MSENGDYIYGKRRLHEIDRRIRLLSTRLESAEVVDPKQQKKLDQVFFSATVTYATELREPARLHGAASNGSQASQLRAAASAPMATVVGAVILGTAIVFSPALASCSARDCAYYGSPDANTSCVVISAPTTGGGQ